MRRSSEFGVVAVLWRTRATTTTTTTTTTGVATAAGGGGSWAGAECSCSGREPQKCCGFYDDVCAARPDSSIVSGEWEGRFAGAGGLWSSEVLLGG